MINKNYFNEIFERNGQVRNHYKSIYGHWKSLPHTTKRSLYHRSKSLFSGDYPQDLLPRVIQQSEFSLLRNGVEQRARAILIFLHNYYSKGKAWKKIIAPSTLASISARHQNHQILGSLDPDSIAFPYGPDIIRDRNGKWRIVEDSAGYVGGLGDLVASRKILYQLLPTYRKITGNSNDPLQFFQQLASYFQDRARKNNGEVVMYLRPFRLEEDHEAQRLAKIFSSLGIHVTTPENSKRLEIRKNGIFLQIGKHRKRVGYLVVPTGPEQMDLAHVGLTLEISYSKKSQLFKQYTSQWILNKLYGRSIEEALLQGLATTNFSPGVSFVNDKMFGLFVNQIIRKFLKEEPLLESIPSRPFYIRNRNGNWRIDKRILNYVVRHKDQFVIKRVDQDGGSGVFIGHKLTRKIFSKLTEKICAEPGKYIFQPFEHLSVLENRIVDLRIHAHVDCQKIIVSNTPWGRANWVNGNGKANLGSNGFTSPVLVV